MANITIFNGKIASVYCSPTSTKIVCSANKIKNNTTGRAITNTKFIDLFNAALNSDCILF